MPDTSTGGVVPPEGTAPDTIHFLRRRHDGEWTTMLWWDGDFPRWYTFGTDGWTEPGTLEREGWTYVCPVTPPGDAAIGGAGG